ncbi:MAG: hypothetical protein IPM94_08100 [bacterium]|nr:hypothetical protein [bacterium]
MKAQPRTILSSEGQISDFVRRIHQDHRGDMWFGTNGDGVIRYDGGSLQGFNVREGFRRRGRFVASSRAPTASSGSALTAA